MIVVLSVSLLDVKVRTSFWRYRDPRQSLNVRPDALSHHAGSAAMGVVPPISLAATSTRNGLMGSLRRRRSLGPGTACAAGAGLACARGTFSWHCTWAPQW